jgi:hypothetical protein
MVDIIKLEAGQSCTTTGPFEVLCKVLILSCWKAGLSLSNGKWMQPSAVSFCRYFCMLDRKGRQTKEPRGPSVRFYFISDYV